MANTTMDVTQQLPQDVMHVLLEGICIYHVKLLIQNLIERDILTINQLNGAIEAFDHGRIPQSQRPTPLKVTDIYSDECRLGYSGMC